MCMASSVYLDKGLKKATVSLQLSWGGAEWEVRGREDGKLS